MRTILVMLDETEREAAGLFSASHRLGNEISSSHKPIMSERSYVREAIAKLSRRGYPSAANAESARP